MAPRSSTFTITELPAPGTRRRAIRFEWDSAHRSAPFQPWEFGLELRTARTDYPGSDVPTEQVLGHAYTPFTLEGRWSDKHNREGYAMETLRQFEELVKSGNVVRLQWDDVQVEGLITETNFTVLRRDEIRYAFTVSPHRRSDQPSSRLRSPRTVLNVRQLREEVLAVQALAAAAHAKAPRNFISGGLYLDIDLSLKSWDLSLATIQVNIDARIVLPNFEPGAALRRMASLFTQLRTDAIDIRVQLGSASSEDHLYYETGALSLSFDLWSRGLSSSARLMIYHSDRAARELTARAQPNAIALYRPYSGEHLYQVSNRFYGSPHSWRAISARNGLLTTTMTGEELLIIPEAPGR